MTSQRDQVITATTARLEELRAALRAENISYDELAELADLAEFISPDDVELLEAAGVPEFPEDERGGAMTKADLVAALAQFDDDDHVRIDASGTDEGGSWPIILVTRSDDGFGPVALLQVTMP